MPATTDVPVQADRARKFALDVLRSLGMPADDAEITADSMVWAGLRGRVTHSLIRLDQVVRRARAGGLELKVDWTPVRDEGVVTVLDAGYGWGLVAGARGMRHAVEKATSHGVGITSVRNCDNTGAMAWHTSHAVTSDMVGLAITNSMPLMPAWGSRHKTLGNQATSIASPAGRHAPLVLDTALSAESLGVIRAAASDGKPLKPGMAVDGDGEPTTDPADWLNGGAVLPIGGHRGYGFALMWEVLTGVLSGGHMLTDVIPMEQLDRHTGNSLFLMAIDPARFMPYGEFLERVDALIDRITQLAPARGFSQVRVPGQDREETADRSRREGIPFPADHVVALRALADQLNVAPLA